MNDIDIFIQNNFRIRYCDKYKGASFIKCECGRDKGLHEHIPTVEEKWSYDNNTKLKRCDTFGFINFTGYDNVANVNKPNFIRFNCENESKIDEAVYRLITSYWHFPRPQLIISVNGGYKRMLFKNEQQKKLFKQGLIEVMKKATTWMIGGGFNIGIHKLVSEAVYEYRLYNDGDDNRIKLIGISTWGVVQNNEKLINEPREDTVSYPHGFSTESGKVSLDAHYDCFLFCDDGTEKQYGKETNFRLKFEEYVRKEAEAFSVQILYEGGKQAIEISYLSLQKHVPLVIVKGSGRAADIIADVLDFQKRTYKEDIISILKENQEYLKIQGSDMGKFQKYLYDIYDVYKKYIVIHDATDKSVKFDKKILEAIISSREEKDLEKLLYLTIQFDCYDIADKKVFQNQRFRELDGNVLRRNFMDVLINNRPEFVHLFLENNFNIEDFLNEQVLLELYQNSIANRNCRCADLICDLILTHDKSFRINQMNGRLLDIIYRVIRQLSGNILDRMNYSRNTVENIPLANNNNSDRSQGRIYRSIFYQPRTPNSLTSRELFLWALLSGYTKMAEIFWKIGKDHIGSALIGSIILDKTGHIIEERGYSDISETLLEASATFQQRAIDVVNEAHDKNQINTYTLLIRALKQWNNMTCLQIAISGDLLSFLHIGACRSYTRKAWMGDLNTFLPLWKIVLNIPFGLVLIRAMIFPSISRENRRTPDMLMNNPMSNMYNRKSNILQHVTYQDGIRKFYQAPIVKFIVNLVSYIFFLFVFAYLNLVELAPLEKRMSIKNNPAEIFVYLYLFGIFIEEIRQVIDQERTGNLYKLKSYFNGFWNTYDVTVITLFVITILLRILISTKNFMVARCFFAVTLSMFCIRAMQFYFISRSIGPKVIMIRKMILDILFFLSIFTLFLIAYGTLFQSIKNPNSPLSISLIIDVFYHPYFQTYGELMLDEFKISGPCNTTDCVFKFTTITFGFAIFLLLTNILLINLLIAMFGHTFKTIQEDSEKFFSFIQIQLVEEFHEKPLLPPPLNILYYIIVFFLWLGNLICTKEKKLQNTFLVKHLSPQETVKIANFEQLCMESSMLKTQSPIKDKSVSTTDPLSETICVDKLFDQPDFAYSLKSNKHTSSRIEKLEQQLDKLIIKP